MRIATLLPSATEIVAALGLGNQLVAISHSCSSPESVLDLPRVTSTRVPYRADSRTIDAFVRSHLAENDALYDLDLAALRLAAPDVVVSQALCDVCAVSTGDVVNALAALPTAPRLVDLTPETLDDVLDDVQRVGEALDARSQAALLVDRLKARIKRIESVTASISPEKRPRVAFLEWLLPPFVGGHWNPELVSLAGGIDVLGVAGKPSRSLTWEDVRAAEPDVLFIACCGFSVERATTDIELLVDNDSWTSIAAVEQQRVHVADGDLFSCPGPRLADGLELLARTLHPDLFAAPRAAGAV